MNTLPLTDEQIDHRKAALHQLLWRIHFWAGLIATPIMLFAALTGLLYVFTPQIEAWRHAVVDHVAVTGPALPLDAQLTAAQADQPHGKPRFIVPAHRPGETTQVFFDLHHHSGAAAEHDHGLPQGRIVYVNPYTAQVVGNLHEMERFQTWAKKLHSSALQGDGWRWLTELGASWMLVMFATGLMLWWPHSQAAGGPGWCALVPRLGQGRQTWRDLHTVLAIAMCGVLGVVLVTGLTWAKYSGENFRILQQALDQGAPRFPKSLSSIAPQGQTPMSLQAAFEHARRVAPDISMSLSPPGKATGVWRIENFDRTQPTKRFRLALDAYSGKVLFFSDWEQLPLLSKATTVGIPFHRTELGVWNQVLLGLAALTVMFSVISGWVMWWKRRPRGRLGAPMTTLRHMREAPWWLWLTAIALSIALPVFGASVAVFAAIESLRLLLSRRDTAAA
ncbi:MAG: PepSY domain-containing protein [Gammaproteobacteria bacterium]